MESLEDHRERYQEDYDNFSLLENLNAIPREMRRIYDEGKDNRIWISEILDWKSLYWLSFPQAGSQSWSDQHVHTLREIKGIAWYLHAGDVCYGLSW